ncbi:MAG: hypothetical protein ACP5GG_05380, partial [Conexivisphaera sp.]
IAGLMPAQAGADVTAQNTALNTWQVGLATGHHLQVTGPGSIALYDGSGNALGANPTKRHIGSASFSQTNGALANDGETIYFNSADGTPYLQDSDGSAFPVFANPPSVVIHAINPPSTLGQIFAQAITPTSFVLAAKTSAQNFSYTPTLTSSSVVYDSAYSATTLNTSDDAYNTNVTESSGVTTQVQFSCTVNTTSFATTTGSGSTEKTSYTYSGEVQFEVQVWSGDMGTLLQSATVDVVWQSTGQPYVASITLPVSIASGAAYTVRVYAISATAVTGVAGCSAAVTATYSAATSVNGCDFIALLIEEW